MQIKVEKLPKSEVKIVIEVKAEEMARFKEKACQKISNEVSIKGFRRGHVPQHVLEEHVGKDLITAQTLEIAIPLTYTDAVHKEKIEVISKPKIKIISQEPFKYEATVAVLPETEVKDYDKIKIKKENDKPEENEVKEAIKYMQKSFAEHKDVERPLKVGDRAEINFEGFDEKGVSLENTKSKNHPLIIGEKTLIEDFEKHLVGLKKDEIKEFTVTFPKKYHAKSLEGKKIKFTVEIKKTQEVILPNIDEKFVERVTGKKMSVKEFEEDVSKNIQARKKEEVKMKHENEFLEEILKRTKTEIPDALLEEEIEFMIDDIKREMSHRGLKFEDYLQHSKLTEDKLKEKYKDEAEKRIKLRLALNAIFRKEKFDIKDSEIKDEIDRITQYYPANEKQKICDMYKNDRDLLIQLKNRILLKKLFDKFLKIE